MPNALREYNTPLKPSPLEARDNNSEASGASRKEAPASADDVPVLVDVGGVCANAIRDAVTRLTGGGKFKREEDMCLLSVEVDARRRRRRASGMARATVVMASYQ